MIRGEILYMESGQVQMTEEGLAFPSFRNLYDSDKNRGKPLLKKYIDALWYVYSKDAPNYYSTSEIDRIAAYNARSITRGGWNSLIRDERFLACANDYVKHIKTRYDIQYEKLMDDIDREIEFLQNIPLTTKVKQTVEVEDDNGEIVKTFRDVEVPNSDARKNAHKSISELFKVQDELKKRIKEENTTIIKKYVRIFDNPNL